MPSAPDRLELHFHQGTIVLRGGLGTQSCPLGRWDPRVGVHRVPGHRHGELRDWLAQSGIPFEDLTELRGAAPPRAETVELRTYQSAALLAWEAAARRGIVVLPTGAGKTHIGLAALTRTGARTLIVVPTRVLLDQWHSALGKAGIAPGRFGDGHHELSEVTVTTSESAWRHMPRLGNRFELLVLDEVHHFGAGARDELLEMSLAPMRLGLSARLSTDEAALARLHELVGPVVCELGLAEVAEHLAPFDRVILRLPLSQGERARLDEETRTFRAVWDAFRRVHPALGWQDFCAIAVRSPEGQRALAAFRAASRIVSFTEAKGRALHTLLERHRQSRTLVFTSENQAAYEIARRHLVMPITCEITRPERERALAAFRAGTLRVLVSARVLDEGLDVPDAEVAIIVGGEHGVRQHVQRVGRVLRPSPGKRAIVYELVTPRTREIRRLEARSEIFLGAAHG